MAFLDKIKQWLKTPTSTSQSNGSPQPCPQSDTPSTSDTSDASALHHTASEDNPPQYLSPITNHLEAWLTKCNWHYKRHDAEHDDTSRTHHLSFTFGDDGYDWNCVLRISEKNQLVTFYGLLLVEVPASHYLNLMSQFADINTHTSFGSIEFDLRTGDIRVKLAIDAEFTELSERALGTYMQGMAGLVDLAHQVYRQAMDETPLDNLSTFIREKTRQDDDGEYYAPTTFTQ